MPPIPDPSSAIQIEIQFAECSAPTTESTTAQPSSGPEHRRDFENVSGVRVRLVATELTGGVGEPGQKILGPSAAGALLSDLIGSKDREHFVVLHLDSRHCVRAVETIAIGNLLAAIVHPREVFKGAILANSKAIICGHNHPSGDLGPSDEDEKIMDRLKSAGELLGIHVLDFLVVSALGHRSLMVTEHSTLELD